MSDNKLQSLQDIFQNKLFRIPDFQRGYSWEIRQLNDFWDDLQNLKENKVHYTGLLTVEPISRKNIERIEKWQEDIWLFERGFKAYYLIDGQQRLTTSIILINEILDTLGENEDIYFKSKKEWQEKFLYQSYKNDYKSYLFGYEKDNPSDEFFKTNILKQFSSSADKVASQTLYTKNLDFSQHFFRDKLSMLSCKDVEQIFIKLIRDFKFNFYEIDEELDIYTTFETMNNRGKPLSNLELLKNRLIYLSTFFDEEIQQRLRKDINEAWKTIYEYIGKNKDKKLDDDAFLQDHWAMYFKYNRKEAEVYVKFLLNEQFTIKNILNENLTISEIKGYVDSLQKTVKYWFYLHNPEYSTYQLETKTWLHKLNRLPMAMFSPLLMSVMSRCEEQVFLPLLKVTERFLFLVFYVSQRRSNTANTYIYSYAYQYEKNEIHLEEIIRKINDLIDGEEQNEKGEVNYRGYLNLTNFNNHIEELYQQKEGFYSWNGLRYFLFEYELHLQKQANGEEKISWMEFSQRDKDETIEHIYPQTATDDYWSKQIKEKLASDRQNNYLLHSLGNLLLLSRTKNASLQNYNFNYKKKHTDKNGNLRGFHNGSYSEIEVAQHSDWTADEIKKRGVKMLDFMNERWNIQFEKRLTNSEKMLSLGDY